MKNTAEVALLQTRPIEELKALRKKLKEFIMSELVEEIDFGTLPGSRKPSLYKPGAEKLAKLFNLGARIVDKDRIIDFEKKHAYYTYTIEIYHLASDKVVAQCEGSANSQEKKYRAVALGDTLNTLQKMAQKRAFVGGIIQAVGASDFYTSDTEDTFVSHAQREIEDSKTYRSEPGGPLLRYPDNFEAPYRIPFGKFRGKGLSEVSKDDLISYCEYLINGAKKDGMTREQLSEAVQDFLSRVEEHLKD